jgi:hypothetical protein
MGRQADNRNLRQVKALWIVVDERAFNVLSRRVKG